MGNRAILTDRNYSKGIYLHWNGGRDSVTGFLEYAKLLKYTNIYDLYTVIKPMLRGSCEICGTSPDDKIGDNGTYIIDFTNMEIVGRKFAPYYEQDEHNLIEFMEHLDSYQPEHLQLKKFISAIPIKSSKDVKVGDRLCTICITTNKYIECEVVGFAGNENFTSNRFLGLPIINRYLNKDKITVNLDNPNNYIEFSNKYSCEYRKIIENKE